MPQKGHVLLIVLLIAALTFGYLIYSGKINLPQKPVTQTSKSDASPVPTGIGDTSNWKTYTNTNGFQIQYPTDWKVNVDDYLDGQNGRVLSHFGISSSDKKVERDLTIDSWPFSGEFQNWCQQNVICKGYGEFKKTKLASTDAYDYTFTKECGNCNYPFVSFFIPNKSIIVQIIKTTYTKSTDTSHKEEVDALNDPIFNQILSTFKFLDQNTTDDVSSQLNGFPVYPNAKFIKKDNYPPCKEGETSGLSFCNENTYTWKTTDDWNMVNTYYSQDKANSGWKCSGGAGSVGSPRDARTTTTCAKGDLHYGLNLNADSQKTEIILGIPLK